MKKLIVLILILSLTAPFIKAQYSKMVTGDRCPFDTAVAIQVKTYRIESRKMLLGDSLIKNMRSQIHNQDSLVMDFKLRDKQNISLIALSVEDKKNMNIAIIKLKNELKYKTVPNWWDRNSKYVIFATGFLSGGTFIHFLKQ